MVELTTNLLESFIVEDNHLNNITTFILLSKESKPRKANGVQNTSIIW